MDPWGTSDDFLPRPPDTPKGRNGAGPGRPVPTNESGNGDGRDFVGSALATETNRAIALPPTLARGPSHSETLNGRYQIGRNLPLKSESDKIFSHSIVIDHPQVGHYSNF